MRLVLTVGDSVYAGRSGPGFSSILDPGLQFAVLHGASRSSPGRSCICKTLTKAGLTFQRAFVVSDVL